MYADNDNVSAKKTTIHHYTAPFYVEEMISSGFIELELHKHFEELKCAANDNVRAAQEFLADFKSTGRYVWFTEAPSSPMAASHATVRFSFFAEDIGAKKWDTVKRDQIKKLGERALDAIDALEQTAISEGEDPKNWWVCPRRVPVTSGDFDVNYKLPDPPYSFEECMSFSELIQVWRRQEMWGFVLAKPRGAAR